MICYQYLKQGQRQIKSRRRKSRKLMADTAFRHYSAYFLAILRTILCAITSRSQHRTWRNIWISVPQIGLLSSCMLIAYGISKGIMSSLADKASPKVFMACGLILCAIVNVGLGFSTGFWILPLWSFQWFVPGYGRWPFIYYHCQLVSA